MCGFGVGSEAEGLLEVGLRGGEIVVRECGGAGAVDGVGLAEGAGRYLCSEQGGGCEGGDACEECDAPGWWAKVHEVCLPRQC